MPTYSIKLIDPLGHEDVFSAESDEYILTSAEYNALDLPSSCRAGSCAVCTGKMSSGVVDQSEGNYLSTQQIGEGYVTLCIAYPLANCVIHTHQEAEVI